MTTTIPARHHLVHENFLTRVEIFLANSRGEAFQINELDYESLICQIDEVRKATERREGVILDEPEGEET